MIAVIFEVIPKTENRNEYLVIANKLTNQLEQTKGFISIERFQSLSDKNKLLSLSFWQDETSVKTWRTQLCHRAAQKKGQEYIFDHYRLRVADIMRDYGMTDRSQVPQQCLEK